MNSTLSLSERFNRIGELLQAHQAIWQPQPFKQPQPDWCQQLPQLDQRLQSLGLATTEQLASNNPALLAWLSPVLPVLAELAGLIDLPALPTHPTATPDAHFWRDIPGRKQAQIEAFVAVSSQASPALEWCAGKGHLGRLLAFGGVADVLSLELDPVLCAAGEALTRRTRQTQRFTAIDVLSPAAATLIAGRHCHALHACGALHRHLVNLACNTSLPSLQLAPCCYYRWADEYYTARSTAGRRSGLRLSRDDLRLAVTETVTADGRENRLRQRGHAWRLGFDALRRQLTGDAAYQPQAPIPTAWLSGSFADFCQHMAQRRAFALPADLDWPYWEHEANVAFLRFSQRSLPRFAFRRAIETWLVLDLALALQEAGYQVAVGTFCPTSLTPRNLLITARRP